MKKIIILGIFLSLIFINIPIIKAINTPLYEIRLNNINNKDNEIKINNVIETKTDLKIPTMLQYIEQLRHNRLMTLGTTHDGCICEVTKDVMGYACFTIGKLIGSDCPRLLFFGLLAIIPLGLLIYGIHYLKTQVAYPYIDCYKHTMEKFTCFYTCDDGEFTHLHTNCDFECDIN